MVVVDVAELLVVVELVFVRVEPVVKVPVVVEVFRAVLVVLLDVTVVRVVVTLTVVPVLVMLVVVAVDCVALVVADTCDVGVALVDVAVVAVVVISLSRWHSLVPIWLCAKWLHRTAPACVM